MANFLQDAKAEWQKLPTAGKVAIGGGIAVFLLYLAYTHQQGGTTTSASGLTSGGLPATSGTTQAPQGAFPGVQSGDSTVPFVPSGVNPVFDSQGGLVAFQQSAVGNPSSSGSVSPPPSSTPPSNTSSGFLGLIGANANVNFKDRTYIDSSGKSVPIPIASSDKLVQGSENRVWYVHNGQQYLLTSGKGPPVQPQGNTPSGGGGESLPSYVRNLTHYQVQYGDNLNRVAQQLRIQGGLPAWMQHNGNPETIFHGMRLEIPR